MEDATKQLFMISEPSDDAMAGILRCGSLCTLVLSFWEILITIDDEVEYIWNRPTTPLIRRSYFFIRYCPLVGQIAFQVMLRFIHSKQPDRATCTLWLWLQSIFGQLGSSTLEIILIIRLCGIYRNNEKIPWILLSSCMMEFALTMGTGIHMTSVVEFNHLCVATSTPKTIMIPIFAAALTHSIMGILTVLKHSFSPRQLWLRSPLMEITLKEGGVIFVLIAITLAGTFSLAFFQRTVALLAFPISTTISSAAGCRLIVNMQTLAVKEPTPSQSVILTSGIHAVLSTPSLYDAQENCPSPWGLSTQSSDDSPATIELRRRLAEVPPPPNLS